MDIPRNINPRRRLLRRAAIGLGLLVAVVGVTVGLSRLEPAAPTVDRSTVWIDTVKRGSFVRQVRGAGTLVPEEIRWIPARTQGRVERILALPGSAVQADTLLLELSNPELELAVQEAESELQEAEAVTSSLRVQLQSQVLTQEAETATAEAEAHQARLQAEANRELAKNGLVPDLTVKLSDVRSTELDKRAAIERRRLDIGAEAVEAQVAEQAARVRRLRAARDMRRSQVESLHVRAGVVGVLQQVPVEVGQQVAPGANLARVAEPGRLKAEVRVPETQARDVEIGLPASIDTRNGIVPGHVTRIDPAAENGTVTVDVALDGPLPKGARPDLSVDGTIELQRLENVLHVGRPALGQEQSTIGLFRLEADGVHATRTPVKLGRSSVNAIELADGLKEGDQVVLSDMSAWDAYDRVRLD
jgi:HlyD family secretion protein